MTHDSNDGMRTLRLRGVPAALLDIELWLQRVHGYRALAQLREVLQKSRKKDPKVGWCK